jgi:glutamate 5-kinase
MANKADKPIVIKVGSSSLTTNKGQLDLANLKKLAAEISQLVKAGQKVVIVTSGAIASGAQHLRLGQPKTIAEKQAAAAVGQSRLMRQYEKAFEKYHIPVAQILLSRDVITNEERKVNAQNCFATLLKEGVIPIVNENDTVAIEEIKFGDNDTLAALTAGLIGAHILIILTDVDGFYMKDEKGNSYLVPEIIEIDTKVTAAAGNSSSNVGTGGMQTKLQAAQICQKAGITMAIIHGRKKGLIKKVLAGEKAGTVFRPR